MNLEDLAQTFYGVQFSGLNQTQQGYLRSYAEVAAAPRSHAVTLPEAKASEFAESQRNHGYTYPYPRPCVTVDMVVFYGAYVALIKRSKDPFAGCWALPGGFLNDNERIEDAAKRELFEETNLVVSDVFPVGVFDDPKRDPRARTISHAFWTVLPVGQPTKLRAGDDASYADWVPLKLIGQNGYELAFDHESILARAIDLRDKLIHERTESK